MKEVETLLISCKFSFDLILIVFKRVVMSDNEDQSLSLNILPSFHRVSIHMTQRRCRIIDIHTLYITGNLYSETHLSFLLNSQNLVNLDRIGDTLYRFTRDIIRVLVTHSINKKDITVTSRGIRILY